MGRHKAVKDGKPKFCLICGDIAKGVNFNALTCMSCKAFFRRNALKRNDEISCPFDDACSINQITRKFCTKCRLKKCLRLGMKKEWILNETEKSLIKQKKATKYLIRKAKEREINSPESYPISPSPSPSTSSTTPDNVNNSDFDLEVSEELLHLSEDDLWSGIDDLDTLFGLDLSEQYSRLLEDDDSWELEELGESPLSLDDNNNDRLEAQIAQIQHPTTSSLFNPPSTFDSPFPPPSPLLHMGLPLGALLDPELAHLNELVDACALLQNPYQRIIDCNNEYYYRQCGASSSSTSTSFASTSTNTQHANIFRTQYHFHRLIRMSKRLHTFSSLPHDDQVRMLKSRLVEMLNLQSILMYNSDRQSWRFIDDRCKSSVMVRMDLIKPFCVNFEAHRAMPSKFRDEWKRDNIIFDLLTAILLFSPQAHYDQYERIKEEHGRYCFLLRRYLETKYPSLEEAAECYRQLMDNVGQGQQLVGDIKTFFRSFGAILRSSPLFVQVFDLREGAEQRQMATTRMESL